MAVFFLATSVVMVIVVKSRDRKTSHKKSHKRTPRVIGMCGPSASGKSTLAAALAKTGIVVVSQDEFFEWKRFEDEDKKITPTVTVENRIWKNWETVQAVNFGKGISFKKCFLPDRITRHSITQSHNLYSHDTDALISKIKTETRKKETNLILVEGHLISQCPELMNEIFDAMIYIDIDVASRK